MNTLIDKGLIKLTPLEGVKNHLNNLNITAPQVWGTCKSEVMS